jgi:hypothetical protein
VSEETADRLSALLARARARHKPPEGPAPSPLAGEDPVVAELVRSFLVWEAGAAFADRALRAIRSAVVDLNELRVFLPEEIAAMFGEGDPRAQERGERLRAALNDVFAREHDVRLSHLSEEGGKRDLRAYLDTLDGMHPFVAARVSLLCFGGHAFPIDGRLRDCLAKARVCAPDQPPPEVAPWVERHVRAGEALPCYLALEALVDSQAPKTPRPASGSRKPAAPRAPKPAAARPKAPRNSGSEK